MSMAISSAAAGPSTSAGSSILNVHTPTTSFSVIHSFTQDSLQTLYHQLSQKQGETVGPGWLKYDFLDTVWNLDDDSDYTIFEWRRQQPSPGDNSNSLLSPSPPTAHFDLYLRNPNRPLPEPSEYRNPSFYLFKPSSSSDRSPSPRPKSSRSNKTNGSKSLNTLAGDRRNQFEDASGLASYRQKFEQFHSENGVRTVLGTFGNVKNVRMLLKSGYRHVYVSRKFALKHGFVSKDVMLGYGYSGLVGIGKIPISLNPSPPDVSNTKKPKVVEMMVYLSEEPHFDVVLGRAFFDKRQIKMDTGDLTDVVCLDTGEKVLCEVVVLKDGKGQFVTVT